MPAWSSRLGCLAFSLVVFAAWVSNGTTAPPAATTDFARRLWDQGQAAMSAGQVEAAIRCYQQSLAADPGMVRNHLSLAAAYLEFKKPERACVHLDTYLYFYPDHLVVRAHFAELLLRLERFKEARREYERFAADCPDRDANDRKQLIHCHSRLMEIAEALEDEYGQRLHRGVGLYLLAQQRAKAETKAEDLEPEGLLCQAAAELTQARLQRPGQARPSWYLYLVWSKLGRREPAVRSLREAEEAAPFSDLTAAEQRGLELADRDRRRPRPGR